MRLNSLVIVNLHSPRERMVGRLMELGVAGITIRGLDLAAFDDWMNDVAAGEDGGGRPSTVFLPLHRIEKILLDEDIGSIPSLANTFLVRVGVSVESYLE